jgi:hypothetical protein
MEMGRKYLAGKGKALQRDLQADISITFFSANNRYTLGAQS